MTPVAGDAFRLTLAAQEARIFINAMKETFREGKGEGIPSREYQTRVGAKVEDVKAIISQIEAAIAS